MSLVMTSEPWSRRLTRRVILTRLWSWMRPFMAYHRGTRSRAARSHFDLGTPDMERLVKGPERNYLDRLWNEFAGNPTKR
jgi:hypothetical protein